MAKRIPPSSWNRDPEKVPAPDRRARATRARTSCRTATDDSAALDEDALILALRRHFPDRDSTGFDLSDFVYAMGSPIEALLYSSLFWPDLIEIDGAILLRTSVEDDDFTQVRTSVRERGRIETEKSFNLREFSDLFGNGLGEIDDDQATVLLARLAHMWRCRLGADFPERSFAVEVWPPEETGGDIAIVFYQARA